MNKVDKVFLYAGIIRFRFLGFVLSTAKRRSTPDNECKGTNKWTISQIFFDFSAVGRIL